MKKVLCNIILFVSLAFLVMPKSASAYIIYENGEPSEACDKAMKALDDDSLLTRYAVSTAIKGAELEIEMDGSEMSSDLKSIKDKIKFKVLKIEGFPGGSEVNSLEVSDYDKIKSDYITSSNKELTVKNNKISVSRTSNLGYKIHLEAVGFEDPKLAKACGKGSTTLRMFFRAEAGGAIPLMDDPYSGEIKTPKIASSSKQIIDCTDYKSKYKPTDPDDFNYQFCYAREMALKSGGGGNKTQAQRDDGIELKCNKVISATSGNDYYVNKKYYFASDTNDFDPLIYHPKYTCGSNATIQGGTCQIKCEEVVTVEYGPPVASKAGLCFEYKVKVTSRVSCGVTKYPNDPVKGQLCTPEPVCTIPGSGIIHRQGGPSEDFDECVIACDGGKYSDYCSNRCYEKVYGENAIKKTSGSEVSFADRLNTNSVNAKVEKVVDPANSHEYYCDGDTIKWGSSHNGDTRSGSADDSRWHHNHSWGFPPMTDYACYSSTGIPRRCTCKESCYWTLGSCSSVHESYMNPEEASKAYNSMVDEHDAYVDSCEDAAKCKTVTSTYTISVKIKNGANIKYPKKSGGYSADRLVYTGIEGTSTPTAGLPGSIIIGNDGCYKTTGGSVKGLWYQAEISFPGAWIHNKTGEISYKAQSDGWQEIKNKFCLPLNVGDVNSEWWQYYYQTVLGKRETVTGSNISYQTTTYNNSEVCKETCRFKNNIIKISNYAPEDWNIIADIKDFGHFKWDFNVKCFYAASSTIITDDPHSECEEECYKTTGYRVRSVDLGNLFPAVDGGSGAAQDPTKVGRAPGFNWSSSAKNTVKNEAFKSNPSEYTKTVQKMADTVYDNKNELDYHLVLTRGIISKLRQSKTFSDFKGNTIVQNGVVHYVSDVIRDDFNVTEGVDIPSAGAVACNNIKGMKTCDEVKD